MRILKFNWIRLTVWSLVVVLVVAGWLWMHHAERRERERLHPILRKIRLSRKEAPDAAWQLKLAEDVLEEERVGASSTNLWNRNSTRAADMTAAEKADLEKMFYDQFRPALERWFAAYEGHLPFRLEDVTLDKFHSTLGNHMFSFMIGDTTLTFVTPRESNQSAKVGYLMVREAVLDMKQLPSKGFIPNLTLPISREDVIQMVKKDSGVEFKPNEVIIRPTGKSSALNGGAFVDLLPTGADPNNALNYEISMVFDATGKLVNYERDPSF